MYREQNNDNSYILVHKGCSNCFDIFLYTDKGDDGEEDLEVCEDKNCGYTKSGEKILM